MTRIVRNKLSLILVLILFLIIGFGVIQLDGSIILANQQTYVNPVAHNIDDLSVLANNGKYYTAKALETIAEGRVTLLENGTDNQALETRITANKAKINAVSIEELIKEEISNPWVYYKFDETSGAIANDSSGNGNNATLINGPTWGKGKYGNAVILDGGNDYIELPNNIVSNLEDITIATWVRLSSVTHWQRIFDFGTATNNFIFLTPLSGSNNLLFELKANGGVTHVINGQSSLPTGVWKHVAFTLSDNVGILYVDGEEVGRNNYITDSTSDMGNTNQNWIGRSQFSADQHLHGQIDDFVIYDRQLSEGAIKELMNSGPLVGNQGDIIIGDINGDGTVTNVDLILLKRYIAGITVVSFGEEAADVNSDGNITNVDLILLNRYIAGIIGSLA